MGVQKSRSMDRKKLSGIELTEALSSIPGWISQDNKLYREFTFKDFSQAFAFMTRLALVSETLDHHPNWSNVYNTVTISLWTHDAGGITSFDIEWAKRANQILESR